MAELRAAAKAHDENLKKLVDQCYESARERGVWREGQQLPPMSPEENIVKEAFAQRRDLVTISSQVDATDRKLALAQGRHGRESTVSIPVATNHGQRIPAQQIVNTPQHRSGLADALKAAAQEIERSRGRGTGLRVRLSLDDDEERGRGRGRGF